MTDNAAPSPADSAARIDYVALAPGRVVGRYEIMAVLGQGGFGITYRARDTQLDREVAIKEYLPVGLAVRQDGASVLPRSTETVDDFDWGRERFIEEGRILAGLHGAPSIVKVFDFLEDNGTAYIVMELLPGETLHERLGAQGPLAAPALDRILWPLLDGLEKVHETGFLHRDIKPANVMLGEDDGPTLIDFGASRAAMAGRSATMTAIFTPGYAAAEQFGSAGQGPWTDIYGFAATLYHAITGTPPPSAIDRLLDDRYEPLARRQPQGAASGLLPGIDAALSLHAEDRPQSIDAWRGLLRKQAVEGDVEPTVVMETVTPRPITPPTPPTPPSMPTKLAIAPHRPVGGRRVALVAALILVAAGSGYTVFAMRGSPTSSAGPEAAAAAPSVAAAAPTEAPRPPPPPMAAQPAGEAEETALHLGPVDRQRIQQALNALGFDTQGSDGSFGPRTREVIAAWQRKRGQPPTGYLSVAQAQQLLRGGQPAPAATADGSYAGSLSASATGGGSAALRPVQTELSLVGRQLSGRLIDAACGVLPVVMAVDASGVISGTVRIVEATGCTQSAATASGHINGSTLALVIRGIDMTLRGTLSLRRAADPRPVNPTIPAPRTDVP